MERISRVRAIILLVIFFVILLLFSVRLFDLQIIETQGNTDNTTVYTTKTRVKASRGDLLDRNGNVLVGNRASYDLVFNHYVIKSADNTNEHLYKLIKMCKELELDYADHFPVTPTRPFEYTLTEGLFPEIPGPQLVRPGLRHHRPPADPEAPGDLQDPRRMDRRGGPRRHRPAL